MPVMHNTVVPDLEDLVPRKRRKLFYTSTVVNLQTSKLEVQSWQNAQVSAGLIVVKYLNTAQGYHGLDDCN